MYIQYIAWCLNIRPLLTWSSWCEIGTCIRKLLLQLVASNLAVLPFLGWKCRCFRDKLPFSWHTSTRGGSGRGPGGRKSIEFYRFLHDSWLRVGLLDVGLEDDPQLGCPRWIQIQMLYMISMKVYYVFFWFVHKYTYIHCILLYIQYMYIYIYTKIALRMIFGSS